MIPPRGAGTPAPPVKEDAVSIGAVVAIYFIVWWTSLFAVLPWGVRSQAESADVTPGTDPGAPVRPLMLYKVIATSLIALVVTAGIVYIMTSGIIALEDIPLPFKTAE
nr:DUF1467 family protein [Xanthobacter aminoxidans]